MATYKGREVEIVKDLPHPQGDQVVILHKDLSLGQEIVQKKDVLINAAEKAVDELKATEAKTATNVENGMKVALVEVKKDTGEFKGQSK